jgi:hypothetical protein
LTSQAPLSSSSAINVISAGIPDGAEYERSFMAASRQVVK